MWADPNRVGDKRFAEPQNDGTAPGSLGAVLAFGLLHGLAEYGLQLFRCDSHSSEWTKSRIKRRVREPLRCAETSRQTRDEFNEVFKSAHPFDPGVSMLIYARLAMYAQNG